MIYEFDGFVPVIDESSFIHPQANVTGNVIIGKDVYVGPGAVIRGDWGKVIIEDGCNVQENCVIHMFPGTTTTLKKGAHLGHGCVIHGAFIGENTLVGMNAVIMDEAKIGKECIVGALSFVSAKTTTQNRKIIAGNPAKEIKDVSDKMLNWKTEGTKLYQQLPKQCKSMLKACEPLREIEKNRPKQKINYQPWGKKN
ncbi:MAG: transferase hexapeptide repeat family protein [Bacteroidota bacterium]|nr:transferase hexapeptide repeat family protein [Bacteroidota bacterium]MEC8969330.1 transferase hexapeptide repeat family protein [Bacteroidota bacterium]